MIRNNLFLTCFFTLVISLCLSSCSERQALHLTVISLDSTRAQSSFLIAYLTDGGARSSGQIPISVQAPYEMDLSASQYFVVVIDTSANGPGFLLSVTRGKRARAQIELHRGTVYAKGSEREGPAVGSLGSFSDHCDSGFR